VTRPGATGSRAGTPVSIASRIRAQRLDDVRGLPARAGHLPDLEQVAVTADVGGEPGSAEADQRGHQLVDRLLHPGRPGDVGADASRAGQPSATPLRLLVGAGVVDHHAGRTSQRLDQRLVGRSELSTAVLVAEVEVAEGLVTQQHGRAEEAVDRWVAEWELALGLRVLGDVVDPDRPALTRDQPEEPVPLRHHPDLLDLLGGQSVRHQVDEGTVVVEDAEDAVLGVGQRAGRLHDPGQDTAQVQVGPDRHHRVEQGTRLRRQFEVHGDRVLPQSLYGLSGYRERRGAASDGTAAVGGRAA
jgi:hypothetical protein